MRFAGRCTIVVIIVVSVTAGIAARTVAAREALTDRPPSHVGAVSPSLLHFLSSQGPGLRQATNQPAATVTKAAAIRDALRHGQWHPVAATGISLVRTSHRAGDVPRGTLAWLVSVRPRAPVYDSADDPPANYVVVVIDAGDGHLLGDMAGYRRVSGHRAGPSWSEGEWTAGPAIHRPPRPTLERPRTPGSWFTSWECCAVLSGPPIATSHCCVAWPAGIARSCR
jgi:hypothetical protein